MTDHHVAIVSAAHVALTDAAAEYPGIAPYLDGMAASLASTPSIDGNGHGEADALHGPWQVLMSDHHGVLCGPLDLDEHDKPAQMTICINRVHPTGLDQPCPQVAYYKTGFNDLAEVRGTYLRAQAMAVGLNLTSAANGIDIVPEETKP
jgi:hypothetical protein